MPQIRDELRDSYDLGLSDDAIEDHIASYQNMVAARHQDSQQMATLYGDKKDIVLSINHGGPCNPAGIRMVDALADVQESLARIAASGNRWPAFSLLDRLKGFIDRGVAGQQATFSRVRDDTKQVREVVDILSVEEGGSLAGRESLFAVKLAEFQSLTDTHRARRSHTDPDAGRPRSARRRFHRTGSARFR